MDRRKRGSRSRKFFAQCCKLSRLTTWDWVLLLRNLETLRLSSVFAPLLPAFGRSGNFRPPWLRIYRTLTRSSEVGVQSSCRGFADPSGVFNHGDVSKLKMLSRSLAYSLRHVRCTPEMNA